MKITATLVEATQVAALATSDQLNRTETHIPGWVVRGAFASSWLRARANRMPSGRFEMSDAERALFVETFEGGVRFSPLFVKDPPTSLSVFGHKYEGARQESSARHGAETELRRAGRPARAAVRPSSRSVAWWRPHRRGPEPA